MRQIIVNYDPVTNDYIVGFMENMEIVGRQRVLGFRVLGGIIHNWLVKGFRD